MNVEKISYLSNKLTGHHLDIVNGNLIIKINNLRITWSNRWNSYVVGFYSRHPECNMLQLNHVETYSDVSSILKLIQNE